MSVFQIFIYKCKLEVNRVFYKISEKSTFQVSEVFQNLF
jgi:hypothetical protein